MNGFALYEFVLAGKEFVQSQIYSRYAAFLSLPGTHQVFDKMLESTLFGNSTSGQDKALSQVCH